MDIVWGAGCVIGWVVGVRIGAMVWGAMFWDVAMAWADAVRGAAKVAAPRHVSANQRRAVEGGVRVVIGDLSLYFRLFGGGVYEHEPS